MITVSCIGCGLRGQRYLKGLSDLGSDKVKVVSLCDIDLVRLRQEQEKYHLSDKDVFTDEEKFFASLKSDLCIVSTQDQQHVQHAIKAMEAGSDVLCEKPISNKESEVRKLLEVQKRTGKKVMICHVLRFAPAFKKIKKLLDDKVIGDLVFIDAMENVYYAHQAHSFVRGNWRRDDETSPMIIAKCCHDLDLLVWYSNSECKSISSVGDLRFFKEENQPEGASDRCTNCKYRGTCPFDAYTIYIKNHFWGREAVTNVRPITDDVLEKELETSPYGRCVFKCDNNVVDHELTQIVFKNGIKANLRMSGFTHDYGRIMKFYGTSGQIDLDECRGTIEVKVFGKEKEVIQISSLIDAISGHGGGDDGLVKAVYEYITTGYTEGVTSLDASIESHLMGFAAEESRLSEGKLLEVKH